MLGLPRLWRWAFGRPPVDSPTAWLYVGAMFAVDHVLVSDALLDAPFCCALSACAGACCVEGDRGAPLAPEERAELERALPIVGPSLPPEAHEVIGREGVWEGNAREGYATTTIGGGACVFVAHRENPTGGRPIAVCAIQEAHAQGKLEWEKPLSCHLYPIRVEAYGEGESRVEVLNYERIGLCEPAVPHGRGLGLQLADFLAKPLARRYGAAWVEAFMAALQARREELGIGPQAGPQASGGAPRATPSAAPAAPVSSPTPEP